MPEKIQRQKNYELFATAIQNQIAGGDLSPGDDLEPEREMMKTYQLGRSSVREALRILESRGLIEQTSNGFKVAERGNPLSQSMSLLVSLNQIDTLQVLEMRKTLEVAIAGFAAERRSDDDLVKMNEAIEEMVAGLAAEQRHVAADLAFHLAVAHAGGNPLFEYVMLAVRDALRRSLLVIYKIPPTAERAIVDHREILAAITSGNPEAAKAAMWHHLKRVHDDIRAELRENPKAAEN